MTRDEMIERLLVDASEERAMISCLRQPGGSTLLSNTTIDRVLSVLGRVAALRAPAVTGEARKALEAARSLLDVRQGHDGDEETGEHYPDCTGCKAEATVALIDAVLAEEVPHVG